MEVYHDADLEDVLYDLGKSAVQDAHETASAGLAAPDRALVILQGPED